MAQTSRFSGFLFRVFALSIASQVAFFLTLFGLIGLGIDIALAFVIAFPITALAFYGAYTRFIAGRTFRRGL